MRKISRSIASFIAGLLLGLVVAPAGAQVSRPLIVTDGVTTCYPTYTLTCASVTCSGVDATCGGGGTVTSIAPANATLTFTPNPIVGSGTIGLNLSNPNTWLTSVAINPGGTSLVPLTVTGVASQNGYVYTGTAPASTSVATGTAAGSALYLTGAAGGATSNASGTGGAGEGGVFIAGAGGAAAVGAGAGGAGGSWLFKPGAGGAGAGSAGAGGTVVAQAPTSSYGTVFQVKNSADAAQLTISDAGVVAALSAITFASGAARTISVAAPSSPGSGNGVLLVGAAANGAGNNAGGATVDSGAPGTGGVAAVLIGADNPLTGRNADATNIVIGNPDSTTEIEGRIDITTALIASDITFNGNDNRALKLNAPTSAGNGKNLAVTAGAALTSGNGGAVQVAGGAGAGASGNGGDVSIAGGAPAGSGTRGNIAIGHTASDIDLLGSLDVSQAKFISNILFSGAANRTVSIDTATSAGAGKDLTVQGGTALTAGAGGGLTLIGGTGAGGGNGGGVTIQGGAPDGAGTRGGIVIGASTGAVTVAGGSATLGFYGTLPVAKQGSALVTAGFTGGGGATVTVDSVFTGNVGATAYTIGDIVAALKTYGLLVQ